MRYEVQVEVMVRYTHHLEAESLEAAQDAAMEKTYADACNPSYAEDSTSVGDGFLLSSGVLCEGCQVVYNPNEHEGNTCTDCLEGAE